MIEAPQAHQAIILIKSYLLVNGLFVKSIFHSKCHIYGFAMQIGWDILLKYTWDFFCFPMAHKFDWCEREGRWMKIVWGWLSGDMGRLQRCSISAWNVSDRKWQLPYGFKSRHNPHTNKQTAHRHRHVHIAATDIYIYRNKLGLNHK